MTMMDATRTAMLILTLAHRLREPIIDEDHRSPSTLTLSVSLPCRIDTVRRADESMLIVV
jgi:hypothetical protein